MFRGDGKAKRGPREYSLFESWCYTEFFEKKKGKEYEESGTEICGDESCMSEYGGREREEKQGKNSFCLAEFLFSPAEDKIAEADTDQ